MSYLRPPHHRVPPLDSGSGYLSSLLGEEFLIRLFSALIDNKRYRLITSINRVPLGKALPFKQRNIKNGKRRHSTYEKKKKNIRETGLNLTKKEKQREKEKNESKERREEKGGETGLKKKPSCISFRGDRVKTVDTFTIHGISQTRNRTKLRLSRAGCGTRQLLDLRVLKNCV